MRSGAAADDPVDVRVAVAGPMLLGEGPMWVGDALWFCDIAGRRLHRFAPASGQARQWEFTSEIGSAAPCVDGSLILALRDGLWHFDPATSARRLVADAPYEMRSQRFNDGKCDAAGRFWVGSMDEERRSAEAALYCYEKGRLSQRQS